jgi:NADH:ubiquinone oxidoreductase subunit E
MVAVIKERRVLDSGDRGMNTIAAEDLARIDEIIAGYPPVEPSVIPALQDINAEFRYIPREGGERLAQHVDIPCSKVFAVATFYRSFTLAPRGEHMVRVCLGTACHLRGAPRIVDAFEKNLGIEIGETTEDGMFSLDTVNCLGACALAPLVKIDEEDYGKMKPSRVPEIVERHAGGP